MILFVFSLFLAFEKQSVNRTKTTNFPPDFYALIQNFIKTKVTSEFALPLYPTVTFSAEATKYSEGFNLTILFAPEPLHKNATPVVIHDHAF